LVPTGTSRALRRIGLPAKQRCGGVKQVGVQRQRTGLESLDDTFRSRARACGAPSDEQRQKMFFGRMCTRRIRRAVAIMSQSVAVGGRQALLQPAGKGVCIRQRFLTPWRRCPIAQIVGRVARSYYEDTLVRE